MGTLTHCTEPDTHVQCKAEEGYDYFYDWFSLEKYVNREFLCPCTGWVCCSSSTFVSK